MLTPLTVAEEQLCRVCRCGEECGPLFYPCKCKGSIRFVHEDCLVQWLKVSQKQNCELCLTEFEFQSVYQNGAPERLNSLQVLLGSLELGIRTLPDISRYFRVGIIWLVIFPLFTARMHSLFFSRRKEQLLAVVTQWDLDTVSKDLIFGIFLASCFVCVILALTVIQDYARRTEWQELGNENINVRNFRRGLDRNLVDIAVEVAANAAADANEFVDEMQAAGENNRLLEFGNRFIRERVASALTIESREDEEAEDTEYHRPRRRIHEEEGDLEFDQTVNSRSNDLPEREDSNVVSLDGTDPLLTERSSDNIPIAAPPRPDGDTVSELDIFERANQEDFDDSDSDDEELLQRRHRDDEDLAWEVLVGLRGSTRKGFYTMTLVAMANTVFLFFFQLIPFSVGRLVLFAVRKTLPEGRTTPFRQSMSSFGITAVDDFDMYTLSMGYLVVLAVALSYLLTRKLRSIWQGRHSPQAHLDIVSRCALFILRILLEVVSMSTIILLELFLLSELVGWVAHIGIMGVSGDFTMVLQSRVEMCISSPFTCVGIHWAVGSVVIANWSALIWAFRQVVHPSFKLRFFEGWYDASKKLKIDLFGPMITLRERQLQRQRQTVSWKQDVKKSISRMVAQKSFFVKDTARYSSSVDWNIEYDQAPLPEQTMENAAANSPNMISQSLDESASYVTTVLLWSIPAALCFLVIPIQVIKMVFPSVFPLQIGSFREPFAEAQLPLDVFLFHSLPYAIERLNLHKVLLELARLVAEVLTKPLDLHGYVLKPLAESMSTGFVHVDIGHKDYSGFRLTGPQSEMTVGSLHISNPQLTPQQIADCRTARNLSVRAETVPLRNALPSLPFLSQLAPGDKVDVIGTVCWVMPWVDIGPRFRDKSSLTWTQHPIHVFTIADTLGYCTPVYLRLGKESNDDLFLDDIESLELTTLETVKHFVVELEGMACDEVALERAQIIKSYLSEYSRPPSEGSCRNVIMFFRAVRGEIQDRPDLVDRFVDLFPIGLVKRFDGGSAKRLLRSVRRIAMLWRDSNAPPVIALKQGFVDSFDGRSLSIGPTSEILVEPDSGGLVQLSRLCFQARRQESSTAGQFCVLRHEPKRLMFRLRVLGAFAVLASVVASITGILLPLIIGRATFMLLGNPLKHDVYHWGGGCFVLWMVYTLSKWFFATALARDGGWLRASYLGFVWLGLGVKWVIVILVFGILVPLLTGTLFELVFLDPFRVDVDRTPVFLIFQDWALGLAVLKAWSRLVLLGIFGETDWVMKLERFNFVDGYEVRLRWVLIDLTAPLLNFLLFRLCTPYFLTRLGEHIFDWDPYTVEYVSRYSYPTFSAFLWFGSVVGTISGWLNTMHDAVFDARYRVGRQLRNR